MKILVTGATGTVGSEVVKALLQRGAEVRALTRKRPEPVKLSDAVEMTWGDLSDRSRSRKRWLAWINSSC